MSSFDILPTPKKDEKIRLWGQENFRRIRDAIVVINSIITSSGTDVDEVQDALDALEARIETLETSKRGNRELGYAECTTHQPGVGETITDLTDLRVEVLIGSYPVMVIGEVQYKKVTADGYVHIEIYDETAGIDVQHVINYTLTNRNGSAVIMVRLDPPVGLRTYKLRAYVQTGTGAVDFFAAGNYPSFIQVAEVDALQPAVLDDFPIEFDTLNELQAAFATLDEMQDFQV